MRTIRSQAGRAPMLLWGILLVSASLSFSNARAAGPLETPRRPVVDEYHGVPVADDYRWLEEASAPEVRAWSDAQNAHARAELDSLPARAAILARLIEVHSGGSPRYSQVAYRAGVYFALKEDPALQQPLLVAFRSLDLSAEAVIVDPNQLDPSFSTTIDFFEPSLDARLVAVSLSEGGSESGAVSVFETATGTRLPDLVPRVNGGTAGGSVAWDADGRGFLRTRYPEPGERAAEDLGFYEQAYHHALGTEAAEDRPVLGTGFPRIAEIFFETSRDGRFVLAQVLNGDGGEVAFWLREGDGSGAAGIPGAQDGFRPVSRFEDGFVLGHLGAEYLFLLERSSSPNGRIVRVPLANPDLAVAETIVPEGGTAIEDFQGTASLLYVAYVDGGPSRVQVFDLSGRPLGCLALPDLVAVGGLVPTEGDGILLRVASYTRPPAWLAFAPAEGGEPATSSAARPAPGTAEPAVASGAAAPAAEFSGRFTDTGLSRRTPVDFSAIDVRREFAVSKDGTRVPLTILLPRGLALDGSAPAYLTGYGGFGVSLAPSFNEERIVWLEQGGVYAIANLRGGGEYGESWHRAGNLTSKQNVFDDFIACAEHLISSGYTSSRRLAIEGGSNGGLLMGAALTQRPELFRAVVSSAGIYDMLRNELTPNGSFNVTEYGTVADPAQFAALHAYSPYHRVEDGRAYPAVLFMTGANDPRVDPYHSRKMTARLQAATSSGLPVLLRTSASTGHGFGTPLAEEHAQSADLFAFLLRQLGVEYREAAGKR